MIARTLAISFTANTRKWKKGVNSIKRDVQRMRASFNRLSASAGKWGMRIAAASAAAAAGFVYMTNRITKSGDEIAKTSKRLGMSAEDVSALGFAAKRSGAEFGDVVKGLRVFARYADEANEGTKEYKDLFDRLGVSTQDTTGNLRPLKDLFLETAEAISVMDNDTEKLAMAQQLFGRGGSALLPLIKSGYVGINDLMREATRLGATWTTEQAQNAEKYQDALTDLKESWGGLVRDLVMTNAPRITGMMESMTDWATQHGDAVINRVWSAWEQIRVKIGDVWDKFTELARNGTLDKWLNNIISLFKVVASAASFALQKVRQTVDKIKNPEKYAAPQLAFGEFEKQIARTFMYTKVTLGDITEKQLKSVYSTQRNPLATTNEQAKEMGFSSKRSMLKAQDLARASIYDEWVKYQEYQKRKGGDATWKGFRIEAASRADDELKKVRASVDIIGKLESDTIDTNKLYNEMTKAFDKFLDGDSKNNSTFISDLFNTKPQARPTLPDITNPYEDKPRPDRKKKPGRVDSLLNEHTGIKLWGTMEAYSAAMRGTRGGMKKPEEKTAKNTEKTANATERAADSLATIISMLPKDDQTIVLGMN